VVWVLALLGAGLSVFLVAAMVVLDYRFHQPIHRVIKLLLAGSLGVSILLKPFVGLFAFPVLAPFLGWVPPVPIPGINALNLLTGGVFVSWAIGRAVSRQPVFRPARLAAPMMWLVGVAAISIVRGWAIPTGYTYDPMAASIELFRAAVSFAVYFVTLSMVQGEQNRRRFAWAIILGLLAEGATTIALGRNGRGARAVGSIGQSNDLGTFLALYSMVAAALIPATRNWFGKALLAAGVVMGLYGIVLSVSRGSVLAAALGLLYVSLRSSRVLTLVLLVAVLTSPVWAPDYLKDRMLGIRSGVEDTDETALDASGQIRVDTWRALMTLVSDHPLDGVGFDGLKVVLPQTGGALGVEVADTSHNTYLRMLAEMGVLGVALFGVMLWSCWKLALDAERAATSKFDRQLAIGLGGATLAIAIACVFGDRFFNPFFMIGFWMLCALANDLLLERAQAAT
jgi:O-antigen ligase